MADVTVRFDRFNTARQSLRQVVSVRESWTHNWTDVDNLHCDYAEWVASPDTSSAGFHWRYGEAVLPGNAAFQTVSKLDRLRWYVRVVFTDPESEEVRKWYGTLEVASDQLDGVRIEDDVATLRGRQSLTAYGLEFLLQQRLILTSIYNDGTPEGGEILRGIGFNEGGRPNRSLNFISDSFLFSSDPATAALWNGQDIVEYLLFHQTTGDRDGQTLQKPPLWELAVAGFGQAKSPPLEVHGRNVRELLDAIMSRQRMMGWYVNVVDDEDETVPVQIVPFNFAPNNILLENVDGDVILANTETRKVVLENDPGATAAYVTSTVDSADQVIVQGRRGTTTFTVSFDDATIEAGWAAAMELEYEAGASGDAAYPGAAEVQERQRVNAESRATPRLAEVYSRFQIPATWDFEAGNGLGTGSTEPVWIDDEQPNVGVPLWTPGLSMRSTLPFLSGFDYEDAIANPAEIAPGPHVEVPPLVITPLPEDTAHYTLVEHVGAAGDLEEGSENEPRTWSATVSVDPDDLAIRVRVHGMPQHVIAKSDFVPADASDVDIHKWDFRDFLFTVCVEVDQYCESRYPTDATIDQRRANAVISGAPRQFRIDAGDSYRLDYVVPQTVIGIDTESGILIRNGVGGAYVNDDRDKLKSIARVAYEWLKDQKKAVEFTTSQWTSEDNLHLGDMITQLGDPDITTDDSAHVIADVNTVVTRVRVEVPRSIGGGNPGVPRWTYSTQFAQFDPLALVAQ